MISRLVSKDLNHTKKERLAELTKTGLVCNSLLHVLCSYTVSLTPAFPYCALQSQGLLSYILRSSQLCFRHYILCAKVTRKKECRCSHHIIYMDLGTQAEDVGSTCPDQRGSFEAIIAKKAKINEVKA